MTNGMVNALASCALLGGMVKAVRKVGSGVM